MKLSFDLIESWLESNPDVLGLKHDGASIFRELALFQDYHGLPSFKNVNALKENKLINLFLLTNMHLWSGKLHC